MPLANKNENNENDVKRNRSPSNKHPLDTKESWYKRLWAKWWGKLLVILMVVVGSIVVAAAGSMGYSYYTKSNSANAAAKVQESFQHKGSIKKLATAPKVNGQYGYGGDNSGIPNKELLKQYQNDKSQTLTPYGAAGTYAQAGLPNPIKSLPIHDGVSNRVLANGWGTVEKGYKMGGKDNILAAHNFADRVTYASPLQDLDVSQNPTFYQTDGKKVYTYKLIKKQTVNIVKQKKEANQAIEHTGTKRIVLITCDEPTMVANLRPDKRIVVSGDLTKVQNLKNAPEKVQNVFPQFKKGA